MTKLVNEELQELSDKMSAYNEKLSKAVYDHYKKAMVLSETNNMRGETGDALKGYFQAVHLNLTQKIINVASEIATAAKNMQRDFLDFEKSPSGIVGTVALDDAKRTVTNSERSFDHLHARSAGLLSRASEFISTTPLPGGKVTNAYHDVITKVDKTKTDLHDHDSKVTSDLKTVEARVDALKRQISDITNHYHSQNDISLSKLNHLTAEDWYTNENKGAFKKMAEDDPFKYSAGSVALYEDQWVQGYNGDIFLTEDVSAFSASGTYTHEDGNYKLDGNASLFNATEHGQITKYLTADARETIGGGSGHLYVGKDGFDAGGNVEGAKLEGSMVLGTENFNGHVSGDVEALTANGNLTIKPPDDKGDYDYHVGLGGSYASAKGSVGLTILGVDDFSGSVKEGDHKAEKSLLGVDASGSVGWQAGFDIQASGSTVYDNKYVKVKSNTLTVDAKFLLGATIKLHYPSIHVKFPW